MSPYGIDDTLYILQLCITLVKPGGPAVPLKVMMVFLLQLHVYFYSYTYLVLNSDWLKSLKNKQKTGNLI